MANVPTTSWDETSPAGSQSILLGDNRIREFKTQVREVIGVDHDFPSSGQAADNGQHLRVTLQEQADLGTGAVGTTILGSQTIATKGELVYTDEDDNDIQITSGGKIKLSSGRLETNTNLTSRNAAGDGDINLIKSNASNQAEVTPALLPAGGIILPEITLPVTAANQGALYTKNDGTQTELYFGEESAGDEVQITKSGKLNTTGLGAIASKSVDTSYEAETDGFVVMYCSVGSAGLIRIKTDSSNPPTSVVGLFQPTEGVGYVTGTLTIPIKKGNYWKAENTSGNTATINWIPIGT